MQVEASPLLCVEWWRVCLDEAQLVESATAKAAEMALKVLCPQYSVHSLSSYKSANTDTEMALKLTTRARWCVTGTPVHRGLEELFGLALFLGSSPWNDKTTWNRALREPYLAACPAAAARAHKWVSGVFWRTQKEDVAHEISLPEQVECLEVLPFTPVEAHYYWQQVLILLALLVQKHEY